MACIPVRYWIMLTLWWIGIISILNRLNINIAIVSMVKEEKNGTKEHPDICPSLSLPSDEETGVGDDVTAELPVILGRLYGNWSRGEDYQRYDWSPEVQGIVMGSFFWTYFICQTPSGYVAGRFGGYVPICVSLLVSGLLSIAIPFVIPVSVYFFITIRVLLGIFQSAIFPGLFVMICSWVPLHERSTAVAINDVGPNVGHLILLFSSGYIVKAAGWQSMFWIPGILSLILFLIVVPFLRNTPESHGLVSREELDIIRGRENNNNNNNNNNNDNKIRGRRTENELEESLTSSQTKEAIPWRAILTNRAVWAMLVFKFCRANLGYFLSSEIPTYLSTVLHEDVVTVGILTGIQYGIHILAIVVGARISETLIVRGFLSRTNSRKTFSLLSGLSSALFLMMIPMFRCNRDAVRGIYLMGGIFVGCATATDSSLPAEMSTKFHGILFALGNLFANMPGFLAPMLSGEVLERVPDRWRAWDINFFFAGGLLICANLFFLLFASAKKQPFDLIPSERRASDAPSLTS